MGPARRIVEIRDSLSRSFLKDWDNLLKIREHSLKLRPAKSYLEFLKKNIIYDLELVSVFFEIQVVFNWLKLDFIMFSSVTEEAPVLKI